jgi:ferritin
MTQPRQPKELSSAVVDMLNNRLKDEYAAHFFYRNAANWCDDANYKKATAFFKQEAANELEHAEKLQKYIVSWNVIPTLPSVKPTIAFTDLVDIINKAYVLEYDLFTKYNTDSVNIMSQDITTFDFLRELREGQYESVVEYSDLLNALQLIDSSDKYQLLYFEQTYF